MTDLPFQGFRPEAAKNLLQTLFPDNVFRADALLAEQLDAVLDSLHPRERFVLQRRYGLIDGKRRTLAQVGTDLGVTGERVRQIQGKAFLKLRHPSRSRKFLTETQPVIADEITALVEEFTQQTVAIRAKPDRTAEEDATLEWADQVVAAILTNDPAAKRRLLGDRSSLN